MDVKLKPELETLVVAEVKAGRSSDPSEFLNKAVYHYVVARDLGQEYTPEEIDHYRRRGSLPPTPRSQRGTPPQQT